MVYSKRTRYMGRSKKAPLIGAGNHNQQHKVPASKFYSKVSNGNHWHSPLILFFLTVLFFFVCGRIKLKWRLHLSTAQMSKVLDYQTWRLSLDYLHLQRVIVNQRDLHNLELGWSDYFPSFPTGVRSECHCMHWTEPQPIRLMILLKGWHGAVCALIWDKAHLTSITLGVKAHFWLDSHLRQINEVEIGLEAIVSWRAIQLSLQISMCFYQTRE